MMKWLLTWTIPDEQIRAIKTFYRAQANKPMVRRRKARNVERKGLDFSKDYFLKVMLCCLVTSQQRSGPESPMADFFRLHPFPVTEAYCKRHRRRLSLMVSRLLSNAGIRLSGKIAQYFADNVVRLQENNWEVLSQLCQHATQDLRSKDRAWEKDLAQAISSASDHGSLKLAGFGPKQARNLLQMMGVSRYEIPIDSRVAGWLNDYGFPYTLSESKALHPALFDVIGAGFQELSRRTGILPCLLDAAIFSAKDGEGWTADNLLF